MAYVPKTATATPAANTVTLLYTPGTGKQAIVSSLTIHNDNAAAAVNARIMFAPSAAADARTQRFYDVQIPADDTFVATVGWTPAETDTLRVWADTANVNFMASIQEGP